MYLTDKNWQSSHGTGKLCLDVQFLLNTVKVNMYVNEQVSARITSPCVNVLSKYFLMETMAKVLMTIQNAHCCTFSVWHISNSTAQGYILLYAGD